MENGSHLLQLADVGGRIDRLYRRERFLNGHFATGRGEVEASFLQGWLQRTGVQNGPRSLIPIFSIMDRVLIYLRFRSL
jgi:hypothetical protein